jgi:hypothetical protein
MPTRPNQDDELAECIRRAALELRNSKGAGEPFVRPWRAFARGDETNDLISCSAGECGCGISPE